MRDVERIKSYWMATMAMGETREEMEQFWSTDVGMEDLMDWFEEELGNGLTGKDMDETIRGLQE